jgi:hypothetical protein
MPEARKKSRGRVLRLAALMTAGFGLLALVRPEIAEHGEVSGRGRPRTGPSRESVTEGFEREDISARDVVKVLAVLALTTAAVIGIVLLMGWRFHATWTATNSVLTSQQTAQMVPPAPHLQVNPFADLARVNARENRMLNTYGWIDPGHTLARIPIRRAEALSVGKSLDAGP